ncbi:hypothetical protein ACRYHF_15035 [Stutzerimonas balearica]|uniref:hypothetical protein n=1 Tax=Stutzerimonas balearica TaxID=74829 RepID=UPI003F5C2133
MLRPVLLCALALSCSSLRAEVQVLPVQRQSGPVLVARVTEQIAAGDYEALLKGLTAHPGRYTRKLLVLDNIGGSVSEAMRMGRLLRETGFDAVIPPEALCQGSCVYLLAAGGQRTVRGHVALQRPFGGDGESLQPNRQRLRQSPQAYLRQMGVAPSLAADIQRVEPGRLRLLSRRDLRRYRLD